MQVCVPSYVSLQYKTAVQEPAGYQSCIDMQLLCRLLALAFTFTSLSSPICSSEHENGTESGGDDQPDDQPKRTTYVYPLMGGNYAKPPIVVYPLPDYNSRPTNIGNDDQTWRYVFKIPGTYSTGSRYTNSRFPDSSVNWNSLDPINGSISPATGKTGISNHSTTGGLQVSRSLPHGRPYGDYEMPLDPNHQHQHGFQQQQHEHREPGFHNPPTHTQSSGASGVSNFRMGGDPGISLTDSQNHHKSPTSLLFQVNDSLDEEAGTVGVDDRRRPEMMMMQRRPTDNAHDSPVATASGAVVSPADQIQNLELDRSLAAAYQYHERQLYQRFQELCIQIRGERCDSRLLSNHRTTGTNFQSQHQQHNHDSYPSHSQHPQSQSQDPQSKEHRYPLVPQVRLPGYGYLY